MSFNQLDIFAGEHYVSWLIRQSQFLAFADFKHFLASRSIITDGMKAYDVFDQSVLSLLALNNSSDTTIQEHSLLPFWQISLGDKNLLHTFSLKETLDSYSLVDEKTVFQFERSWHSCPKCRQEDIENYGTSYWHVLHQIPSTFRCTKHLSVLEKSTTPIRNLHYGLLPHQVFSWQPVISTISDSMEKWHQFVVSMQQLSISNPAKFANLQVKINSFLGMDGRSGSADISRCAELTPAMEGFLGNELLAYLFKDYARPSKRGRLQILNSLFVNTRRFFMLRSPVYWVLLAYWLKDEIFI